MEIYHFVAFNLALLAAIASPGPAMLYAMRATLSGGRSAGIATGCGLGAMAAMWTLLALLGLDGLFRLFPWAFATFKVIGALYLIYVAWGAWRSAYDPVGETARTRAGAFAGGILVNLANPKSVLFAAAVLLVIFPAGLTLTEKAMIVGNHLVIELIAYTGFALVLSTRSVSARYLRTKPVMDRVAAVVLGSLGVRLILDR